MKNILFLIAILVSMATRAQVSKVYLQASGLTCSMCSNSIYKSLKTLDFIDNVNADVKNYTFEISFKPGLYVDFDKIKRKVESAGFSVSGFAATIYFNNIAVEDNKPVVAGGYNFLFTNIKEQTINGVREVKFLDKGFVSSKEYKGNEFAALAGDKVYHVSL